MDEAWKACGTVEIMRNVIPTEAIEANTTPTRGRPDWVATLSKLGDRDRSRPRTLKIQMYCVFDFAIASLPSIYKQQINQHLCLYSANNLIIWPEIESLP